MRTCTDYVIIPTCTADIMCTCTDYVIIPTCTGDIMRTCTDYVIIPTCTGDIMRKCTDYVIIPICTGDIMRTCTDYVIISICTGDIMRTCNDYIIIPICTGDIMRKCTDYVIIPICTGDIMSTCTDNVIIPICTGDIMSTCTDNVIIPICTGDIMLTCTDNVIIPICTGDIMCTCTDYVIIPICTGDIIRTCTDYLIIPICTGDIMRTCTDYLIIPICTGDIMLTCTDYIIIPTCTGDIMHTCTDYIIIPICTGLCLFTMLWGEGGTARFREEVGVCGSHVSFSLPEHSPSERRPGPQPGPSLREDVFDGLEEDFSGLHGSWTDSIRLEPDDGPQQDVRPVGHKEDQPRQLAQQGRPAVTSTGGGREITGQRSSGLQATFSGPSGIRTTESTSAGEKGLLNVGGSDVTLCGVRSVDCDSVTGSVVEGLKVLLAKLEGVGPAQRVGVERAWVPVDRSAGVSVVERVEDCSVAVPGVSGGGGAVVAQTSGPIVGSSGLVSRQGEGAELRVADTAMSRSCLCSIGPLGMHLTSEVKEKIYKREFIEFFSLLPLEQSFEIPEDSKKDVAKKEEEERKKRYRKLPKTFSNWSQAFLIYANVFASKFPDQGAALFCYLDEVSSAQRTYGGMAWWSYDEQFRQRLSVKPEMRWDDRDMGLWLKIMTPLRSSQSFRSGAGGASIGGSPATVRKGCCFAYNEKFCKWGAACKFKHECSGCGGAHSYAKCFRKGKPSGVGDASDKGGDPGETRRDGALARPVR
ncbi:uncharacterized protein LOC128664914 [Bombina bombina]|uniref:uncharacterized protein LOC128664914 n=1 Tax=Bombina bombina TaxID=8345 RepID=UPI00235B1C35|nr:uncharacterized protein LOC128664914 [Bombina bombina]